MLQRRTVHHEYGDLVFSSWENIPPGNIDQSDHLAHIHATLVSLGPLARRLTIVHSDGTHSDYRLFSLEGGGDVENPA